MITSALSKYEAEQLIAKHLPPVRESIRMLHAKLDLILANSSDKELLKAVLESGLVGKNGLGDG